MEVRFQSPNKSLMGIFWGFVVGVGWGVGGVSCMGGLLLFSFSSLLFLWLIWLL